jgi:hypothetical protein
MRSDAPGAHGGTRARRPGFASRDWCRKQCGPTYPGLMEETRARIRGLAAVRVVQWGSVRVLVWEEIASKHRSMDQRACVIQSRRAPLAVAYALVLYLSQIIHGRKPAHAGALFLYEPRVRRTALFPALDAGRKPGAACIGSFTVHGTQIPGRRALSLLFFTRAIDTRRSPQDTLSRQQLRVGGPICKQVLHLCPIICIWDRIR